MKALLRLLPVILLPGSLAAEGLTDLRASLPKLTSNSSDHRPGRDHDATLGGETDKQEKADGVSAVLVRLDAAGLALSWTPEQIRQTRRAAAEKAANPDAPKASLATLAALEADEALNLLDAADPLRLLLDKAAQAPRR